MREDTGREREEGKRPLHIAFEERPPAADPDASGSKTQELEELLRVFLPPSDYRRTEDPAEAELLVPYDADGNRRKRFLYEELCRRTGKRSEWGILTGVRPVKLAGKILQEAGEEEAARTLLRERYLLSEAKAAELLEIYLLQQRRYGQAPPGSCGVYVGIPFCPSRCLYCSFPSYQEGPEERARYLKALHREIRATGRLMEEQGLWCESLYLGGGTPTSLEAEELRALLQLLREAIPGLGAAGEENAGGEAGERRGCREICLEGGRPDSLTEEKLKIAAEEGVDRLSINPQSMQERTLTRIGRGHTVGEICEAFALARAAGFRDINADLIAGLPGEDPEDMKDSLHRLLELAPEEITIHSLAVKRSSRLHEEDKEYHYRSGEIVRTMLEEGAARLRKEGYRPYYLYRQKNMAGAGENTGWCLAGREGLYNIRIMEENQSILAMGAGAMSKRFDPADGRIARVPNLSNYRLYIERIEEMIRRKRELFEEG